MGSITIRVPQNIRVQYAVEDRFITRRLLEVLNDMMLRLQPGREKPDELLGLFADEADLLDDIIASAMHTRETVPFREGGDEQGPV